MDCPSCGMEQPAQAKFCNECGSPMPDTQHDLVQDSQKPGPSSPGKKQKAILKISLIAGGAVIAIVVLLVFLAGGSNDVAGKYYDERGFAFELKPDGTVSYSETDTAILGRDGMMGGTYTTSGDRIIFRDEFSGTQIEGNIDDGRIVIQGEVYIKR